MKEERCPWCRVSVDVCSAMPCASRANLVKPNGSFPDATIPIVDLARLLDLIGGATFGPLDQEQIAKAGELLRHYGFDLTKFKAPDMTRERVVCAAVTVGTHVICGHRHHDAMKVAYDGGFTAYVSQDMQGFLTTKGRYVDRAEALALQIAAGVPSADPAKDGGYKHAKLYSEDVY